MFEESQTGQLLRPIHFRKANRLRSVGATNLNSKSSRSHAILTINITRYLGDRSMLFLHHLVTRLIVMSQLFVVQSTWWTSPGARTTRYRNPKWLFESNTCLRVICKLTGNDSERMLESAAINKSLSVLGQVVHDLNRGASRVPFRNSKLTRLLQDALGGSSLGLLICNIAPGRTFRTDTLNTLKCGLKNWLENIADNGPL